VKQKVLAFIRQPHVITLSEFFFTYYTSQLLVISMAAAEGQPQNAATLLSLLFLLQMQKTTLRTF